MSDIDASKADMQLYKPVATIASAVIDGSRLEGGGQLVRNAVALSALMSKPIIVQNIRQNRVPPGLKKQHQAGIQLVGEIASATLAGVRDCSTEIHFHPGALRLSREYKADSKTAGSTALLLQVALPTILFFSAPTSPPTRLVLRGGTNALHAPQIDYTSVVLLPFLRRLGLEPHLDVRRRGYWPKGGGEVEFALPPVPGPLRPVTMLTRGAVRAVRGRAYVSGVPAFLAREMRDAAMAYLVSRGVDASVIDIEAVRERDKDALGGASGIFVWAETVEGCLIAGSAVGMKLLHPKTVGEEAAELLWRNLEHGGCVDEFMQDQMIIFLALAKGESIVKTGPLTLHTKTAIWVAEQLTDAKFEIEEDSSGQGVLIRCQGIGLTAEQIPHTNKTEASPPPRAKSRVLYDSLSKR
ncbi:hypothetical protein HETIRDRAFT_379682 [Heterobasidion irregulare TC 32-1]|uniref:RNA 3'-terminal-phosphate cyclase (ATP) n=1 Tax=Heterobasidion irregulare (strain TC 32-1) TaxID=747525 RepID=W4KKQ0_HETIT|nr:uncharacterized protein HETIRDRAFT_379682 [Heterobasidion irregulare TC 32-1]ETW85646.1 hypothetical protein HETIRDRAFT_379682 [Heterobasidion irregulare TC 32-1]